MGYRDPERQREYCKAHYRRNKAQYLANNKRTKERLKAYVNELKSKPCADCQKTYPTICMDFDHRDGATKTNIVSRLLAQRFAKRVREEIAKCDLVCSNCHRIRTYNRIMSKFGAKNSNLTKKLNEINMVP